MSRRRTALGVLAFVVMGAGVAWLALGRDDGDGGYTALFTNARGLVAGTDVRVGGAIAGRVRQVSLSDDGSALVRFTLKSARVRPRADAAAAIRPVDLLGDNYLSLSPGHASAPLHGAIPASRTSNAPRLDELLSTFRAPVRDALQTMLVEAGLALDDRGEDLSDVAVALRPALQAADRVATELDAQNRSLARAVTSADRAVGQLAGRSQDIGPLVDGLARTVRATAGRPVALDRSLAAMPRTLSTLKTTANQLAATATTATPLAADLRDTAPQLTAAVTGLAPLLSRVRSAASDLRPAVRSLTSLLARNAPTITALDRGIERIRATAPQTAQLIDALVPVAPQIAQGFFVDFPDQAQEPGTQPGDPFADPKRAYWRGAAVLSCEAFGVPVKPGCLSDVLKAFSPAATAKSDTPAATTKTAATSPAAATTPAKPAGGVTPLAKKVTDPLLTLLPKTGPLAPAAGQTTTTVNDLLDFLLGR